MGDSTLKHRNFYQILLCSLYAFSYSSSNFTGLSKTVTNDSITITDNNYSCKSESAATLSYLNYSIDSNQSILQFFCINVYSVCHNLLEFKSTFTCTFSNFFDTAMIKVAVTVEYHRSNTCCKSFCSYSFTYLSGLFFLRHSFHAQ